MRLSNHRGARDFLLADLYMASSKWIFYTLIVLYSLYYITIYIIIYIGP